MKRIDAVKKIMDDVTDELVIASTGMISREVYYIKDRVENFYVSGSMGNSLAIGIGLALNTTRKVIVISGDADALMGLGSLVTAAYFKLKNLKHYILDNGVHGSTGNQSTCSSAIDFSSVGNTIVIKVEKEIEFAAPRIELSPEEIKNRFLSALRR